MFGSITGPTARGIDPAVKSLAWETELFRRAFSENWPRPSNASS